jgi:rod shape determining protein RodA
MVGVNKEGTGARAFAGAGYVAAGKTGTAQVFSYKGAEHKTESMAAHLRDHALFIAFAPADKPKIALAVLVENGGFGAQAAAPIARQVLDYYLLGKKPKAPAPPDEAAVEGDGNEPRLRPGTLREWWQKLVAPLDGPLMLIAGMLLLLAIGIMASASPERINAQLINVAVALVVMRVLAQVPPQRLMHLAVPIYVAGVLLLIAVALFGDVSKGARRWLNLGFMRAQPSELMKIAMPLMLAWFFQQREAMPRLRDYALPPLLLLPVGLIARQPDLGTAILVLAAGFYVIFFAGLSWKIMIGMAGSAIAAAPLAWNLLHDYQRNRIITLFDPEKGPAGQGLPHHPVHHRHRLRRHLRQGLAFRHPGPARVHSERHTDFIFAVFSEEFGLFGNLVLLVLYALLIGRGLMIAANAATLFSRLLAGAVTMIFFTYAFVNMGMVSGILPVVGVPLPLVSYGGTALVTLFIGIGILMSIHGNRMLVQK